MGLFNKVFLLPVIIYSFFLTKMYLDDDNVYGEAPKQIGGELIKGAGSRLNGWYP